MNTAKVYYDTEGNQRTLSQMVEHEPQWAASRLRHCEEISSQLKDFREAIEFIASQKDKKSNWAVELAKRVLVDHPKWLL